jgi:hypothetical protein
MKSIICIIILFSFSLSYSTPNDFWIIIPGKNVGKITANTTEKELISIFGKENVKRDIIGMGEGETTDGTIIYKDAKNELKILWSNSFSPPIERIIIDKKNTNWKTKDNISIGTSLEYLLKLNGKAITFYGFEWDYAGTVTSWNNGKLDNDYKIGKKFAFDLTYGSKISYKDIQHLIGDSEFSSSEAGVKNLELKINSIAIFFSKNAEITAKIISDKGLRIRENSSANSKIISIIPFNESVYIIEKSDKEEIINNKKGKWVKVKWKNYTGWVFDAFIDYQ